MKTLLNVVSPSAKAYMCPKINISTYSRPVIHKD